MTKRLPSCLLVLGACGGHEAGDPATTPIPAIASDAVFVVNGGDNSISVIDAERDALAGTIELQNVEYPHHVYLSPDRATLLVAITGSDLSGGHGGGGHGGGSGGAVLALDATTGALKVARRLDAPNHNAAFAPDGKVWTTQMASPGEVLVLDGQTLATVMSAAVENEPAEVTFSASGAHAFVANTGSDSVSVFDATSGAFVKTLAVGDAPVGAWPASDGRMYVDNETGKSLSVIDTATLEVVRTIDLGFTPALAALAPNGELWVTDTGNGKLVFLSATDGAKQGEIATGAGAHAIAFSAAGTRVYVTNQEADNVSVVDVASRSVTKTIDVGSKPNGVLFRAR